VAQCAAWCGCSWAEAILMGIVGGLIGSAFGILGSIWLGKTVFGVAAQPSLDCVSVSVGITIIVSDCQRIPPCADWRAYGLQTCFEGEA